MISRNILAGLDAWLDAHPAPGSAAITAPAPNLKKPEISTALVAGRTAANDPASPPGRMIVHDRVAGDAGRQFDTQPIPMEVSKPITRETAPVQASGWRPLADAYYLHHFNCLYCIAAGQNPRLRRCTVGRPLWDAYQAASDRDSGRA
jgi:hypothetical protein